MANNFKMPPQPGGTYVYSQFAQFQENSLYLTLEDDNGNILAKLPLVAFSSNFALNEIPQATCTVGVGRDTTSDGGLTLAPIHSSFNWRKLQPAKVYFYPGGNSSKDTAWPKTQFLIFDGYVTAIRRIKSLGKYQVEISLTHWLFDLACSSAVSGSSHVANPSDMTAAAVFGTGVNASSAYTANVLGKNVANIDGVISSDLWAALKSVFSAYANGQVKPLKQITGCLDVIVAKNNTRALRALKRIEGPDVTSPKTTNKNYDYGAALKFDFSDLSRSLIRGINNSINQELIKTYAESSFWTKLVSQFCPIFGLAVVPMIDSALVIADTPIFTAASKQPYKVITPEDYDNETAAGAMERPISGVIVVSSATSATNAVTPNNVKNIIGCYAADPLNDDGVVLTVGTPPWLDYIPDKERTDPQQSDAAAANTVRDLFNRWAKDVYVRNALRGRTQTLSGRLRFDIAPGSIVRISSSQDVIQAATDDKLAFDTYGQVARVSIFINTEAPAAGTSFLLTNVRTAEEYAGDTGKNVYSVDRPAIFTAESIHGKGLHGAPLNTLFG